MQLLHRDGEHAASEMESEAAMDTGAECKMTVDLALGIEGVGVLEDGLVAPRR